MPPPDSPGWHPPKRLRQLEYIGGRGLLLGCGSKGVAPAAHYVTLAARSTEQNSGGDGGAGPSSDASWRLVYRSEVVGGTSNPEWWPLRWEDQPPAQSDPLVDGSRVEVLLALHALEPGQQQQQQQQQGLPAELTQPVLFDAASRPAVQLPGSLRRGEAAAPAAAPAAAESAAGPVAAAADAAAAEPAAASSAESAAAGSAQAEQGMSQNEQRARAQTATAAEWASEQQQNGMGTPGPAEEEQEQQPQQNVQQQQNVQPQASINEQQADATGSRSREPADAAGAPGAAADWLAAAAEALLGTGCCPGRLVAAWRLTSLGELFAAGSDLALLRQPLQANTLVLSFADGQYLCPPPLQVQEREGGMAPNSLQASPLKGVLLHSVTGLGGDERGGDGGTAGSIAGVPGPIRRGFASLLVSKLLRSAPNLQEAGSLGSADLAFDGAALSDAESDNDSDATGVAAASRHTPATATAAGELPATAARAAAAAAAAAAAGGGSGSGNARPLTLATAHQYVMSLAALQSRMRNLAVRSHELQAALATHLDLEQRRRQQQAELATAAADAARCRQCAEEAQQQLAEVKAATVAARKVATVRAQALVTTLKVMQAADRRVGEAEASLRGEEGHGALVAALRELVARRCQMVCQLGAIFQLGPTAVSIPEAPPGGYLEDRLERQWAGAAGANGGGGGQSPLGASSSAALAPPPAYYSGSSGGGFGDGGGTVDSPSKYRQEMRLSIGGLEVRPSVWRKAFDDGGYDSDAAEDRAAGVALGYVAQVKWAPGCLVFLQVVDRLAAYLDVPLRYPLALRGSRSVVVDNHPPAGTWAEVVDLDGAPRRPLFGRGGGSSGAAAAAAAVEYPLYCDSNRDRARFAVGVFLLNKDVIQLLQAHGISASGPNHILQNLYKLLLAAQSALPLPRLPVPATAGGSWGGAG